MTPEEIEQRTAAALNAVAQHDEAAALNHAIPVIAALAGDIHRVALALQTIAVDGIKVR